MTISPGARLGFYEITAALGAGGMGEVFRARDTKLNREVAIKVLPAAFADDPERLARFTREAQTLASLNHPNIATIYGIEEVPAVSGSTGPGSRALVMELIEGEDLSTHIARGPIPIAEALPIARQIAEALEAAHEHAIVHRDLKPANIKVRTDGTVKVLDFGLAKAMDPAGASSSNPVVSHSPTLTHQGTIAGMIIGTAAYMSPEQAKGKAVDKRTDIWAFGVVLYEMLTGSRLFAAEDVSETLAAVLTRAVSLTSLPPGTPSGLKALVRDCLIRDSKQRLRDIGHARIVIARIESGAPDDAVAALAASPAAPPSSWSRALPAMTALLVVALGIALWAPWRSEPPGDRPLVRLDVDLGADVAFPSAFSTSGSSLAISPDGTRLVYLSGSPTRLFTRRLDQPKATELPGTQGAGQPFFSPDGQWVWFVANGKLNKISVEGGAVVPLQDLSGFGGASWAEDGSLFVTETGGRGLLQFPAVSGAPRIVAPLDDGGPLLYPQLLPGGKAILFATSFGVVGGWDANIEVLTLADGRRKILARGGQSPRYLPSPHGTGHLVYVNKGTLFAIPFDPAKLETRGAAIPVLDDVANAPRPGTSQFDVSRTGTVIYRKSRAVPRVMTTLQWVDGSGKKVALLARPGAYESPRVSPDGRRIALGVREGDGFDISVYDPQRDALTRLTVGGDSLYPVWSPDSQYVVFTKRSEGIFQARVDGATQPQYLTGSKALPIPRSFTPDGRRLAYWEEFAGSPQIWTVPLHDEGGQLRSGTPEQFSRSSFRNTEPSFSPDGRWLAYQSAESGASEVYVRAFPPASSGQGGKWPISNNGGSDARWSRTGHELVYRSGDQLMAVSYSVKGDTFIAEKPRVWIAALGGTSWDLAPDGKRVAVLIPEGPVQAPPPEHEIVLLQNFGDDLKRRVPLKK